MKRYLFATLAIFVLAAAIGSWLFLIAPQETHSWKPLPVSSSESYERPFVPIQPTAGSFELVREIPEIQLSEYLLSNRMRVIVKQTGYESDDIVMLGYASGGYSSVSEEDQISARLAKYIIAQTEFGEDVQTELTHLMAFHSVDLDLKVGPYSRGFIIEGAPGGLEAMCRATHLLFSRIDHEAEVFDETIKRIRQVLVSRSEKPELLFDEIRREINSEHHSLLRSITPEDLDHASYPIALDFFRRAYSRPDDFLVILVGDFDKVQMEQMLNTYLASIPNNQVTPLELVKEEIHFPPGQTKQGFRLGPVDEEIAAYLSFPLEIKLDGHRVRMLDSACQLMETAIRNAFVKEYGETYAARISYEMPCYPVVDPTWITVIFNAPPKQPEISSKMRQTCIDVIHRIREQGPTAEELKTVKRMHTQFDRYWLSVPHYWAVSLMHAELWNEDPLLIKDAEERIQSINALSLQVFVKDSFPTDNFTFLEQLPKREN